MKRLSGTDSLFLTLETPSWHQHVGGLVILEPGTRPVTYDDIVESVEERLAFAPKFRWKLKTMPLALDIPVWVDDPGFDVRRHIRRLAVPSPGGSKETAEVAGLLMSTKIDRNHPLWEMWVLEGLEGGRVGLMMKYHHCLLDGVAGASLATVLLDLEPDADSPLVPPPSADQQSAGPEPNLVDNALHVASTVVRRPFRIPGYLVGGALKLSSAAVRTLTNTQSQPRILRAPDTHFNRVIGPGRAMSFASVAMADLKQLRRHFDVKINDLVIAVVAGALRSYLLAMGDLPSAPLVTSMPVSLHPQGDTEQTNSVTAVRVSMATDVADPVRRLKLIAESAAGAKAMQRAMSARQIQSLGEVASPLLLSLAIGAVHRTHLLSRGPQIVNTIVSNVPGPPVPLYMCGARVIGIYPLSIIVETMGINCTVMSYMDRVDFGFVVDPGLVSDPWIVSRGVHEALGDLKAAAGLGTLTEIVDAFGQPIAPLATPTGRHGKPVTAAARGS